MKISLILTISICLIVLSCQNQQCNCEYDDRTLIENDSILNSADVEHAIEGRFTNIGEPILDSVMNESYRFSALFSYERYFKVYRIVHHENQYHLEVKEYANSDTVLRNFSKALTESQWSEITNEFEKNCFWTMPIDVKENYGYLDASSWLLEAKKANNPCTKSKYHLVARASPDSSAFLRICEKFMELDSLNLRQF